MNKLKYYFPELSNHQIKQFEMLPGLFNYWNSKINVISRKDIAEIDTAIKGLSEKNPWHSIRELALNF